MTQEQINNLIAENEAYKEQLKEMNADITTTVKAVIHTCDDLGIDTTGEEEQSMVMLLPNITAKLMTGQIEFDKIKAILPMLQKYKHLVKR